MGLPNYRQLELKDSSLEELQRLLTAELNLKQPVVLNLKQLDLDQQREVIGLVENFFAEKNISHRFPYPVIFISDHEPSISSVRLVQSSAELPRFFQHKDSRLNVKESHVASRNRLLQQEVHNSDPAVSEESIQRYAELHRQIRALEQERVFLQSILGRLEGGQKDG
jgi:hypothetical protein